MANIWKPPVAKKPTTPTPAPANPLAPVNFDIYKTQSAAVQDIGNKYGIDYTREYAKRQAEAAAAAKRTGLQNQSKQVDLGVKNAQDAVSRDYFQKGLETAQSNVNGGMNQGLANEANLRLSMNRQGVTADMFRQANLQKNEIQQGLTDVETARVAQEEQIYQERLAQAIALINENRQLDQSEKQMLLNAALQQRGQNIDMDQFGQRLGWDKSQFSQQLGWDKYQFNNMSATDQARTEWEKYVFNNMSAEQKAMLDWSKYQFQNISATDQATNKLAYARLEQEKKQFDSELKWRQYEYTHMSLKDQQELNQRRKEFGDEMAWKQYELQKTQEYAVEAAEAEANAMAQYEYGGGGGGGDLAGIP